MINQSDSNEWKTQPVTRAFFLAAQERVEECKDVLSYSAGAEPLQDSMLVGLIRAYREMMEFRVEDASNDD